MGGGGGTKRVRERKKERGGGRKRCHCVVFIICNSHLDECVCEISSANNYNIFNIMFINLRSFGKCPELQPVD